MNKEQESKLAIEALAILKQLIVVYKKYGAEKYLPGDLIFFSMVAENTLRKNEQDVAIVQPRKNDPTQKN